VKIRDLTELAARNLREALLRNSLTTLGIAVGVASLVAMVSLGVGLQELASKRLSSSGLFDAVFVGPKMNDRGFGRPPRQTAGAPAEDRPLDEDARQQMTKLPNVVEVYPEIRFSTEILYDSNSYMTMVAGIPDSARNGGAFDGMKGSFFSSPDADEAILQLEFAKQLSDKPDSLIGKEITIRYAERQALPPDNSSKAAAKPPAKNAAGSGTTGSAADSGLSAGFNVIPRQAKLRIVGIVETEPAAGFGGFGRGRVLIPQGPAQKLSAAQQNDLRDILRASSGNRPSGRAYASLTVRVKRPADVQATEDASKGLRLVFSVFDAILALFGSLALIVASLGIINTLVMAILERRREIGVLKALGASDGDVRKLFFAEAGAMGLFGGVLGVFIGWLIGRGLTLGTNIYLRRQDLPDIQISSVPWWMVAAAIAFSIAVSLAAGLYPASRASKLNPVEALRYE
jgi:putative ABC transport system permease protein